MTREETKQRLTKLRSEETPAHYNGTFREFCAIHEAALYEEALKHNVDPDSVWFAYEIKEGKGTPWPDSNREDK